MKNFILLLIIAGFSSINSSAQNNQFPNQLSSGNKPRLFEQYAEKIIFSTKDIAPLFDIAAGNLVSARTDGNFPLTGQVICNVSKYNNTISSVVIRSYNFPGALIQVTRTLDANGTISYSGSMINKESADGYILKKEEGQYTMIRKNLADIITE